MKTRKLLQLGTATVLSLSSLLTLAVPAVHAAGAPYTCTWTGAGSDANFTTGANWSGCNGTNVAPVAADHDNLVFPYGTGVPTHGLTDDMTAGSVFGSITFSGTPANSESGYSLSGNSFGLTGGISNTSGTFATINNAVAFSADQTIATGTGSLDFEGVLSGTGNLTKTGTGYLSLDGANTFTGNFVANAGDVYADGLSALGTTAGSTTINDGADIYFSPGDCNTTTYTVAEPLVLNGASSTPTGDSAVAKLNTQVGICAGGAGADVEYGSSYSATPGSVVTLSGPITLGADATFSSFAETTTLTGALSGAHAFTVLPGGIGNLVVNGSSNTTSTANGTYQPAVFTETLSDSLPSTSIGIDRNAAITLDGTRGDVYVGDGGVLYGSGTAGTLSVAGGGTVAPGHSPGCLNTGDLTLNGIYNVDVGGTTPCTGYDQLNVTGAVDVTGATLNASPYNGYVPKAGEAYTIISNDGSDAVTGTFNGISEGGTYTNDGVTYNVTYKGGDGNDVVLTVASVDASKLPSKPNTGIKLVAAHPLSVLATTMVVAFGLVIASRKFKTSNR